MSSYSINVSYGKSLYGVYLYIWYMYLLSYLYHHSFDHRKSFIIFRMEEWPTLIILMKVSNSLKFLKICWIQFMLAGVLVILNIAQFIPDHLQMWISGIGHYQLTKWSDGQTAGEYHKTCSCPFVRYFRMFFGMISQ